MGILVNSKTRVMVQGITGVQGSFHAKLMLEYGTNIVAGTSPGKGGTTVHGVPVYDTVGEAQERYSVDASVVFVPAPYVLDAALEALENGVKTVVVVTEHVPIKDAVTLMAFAKTVGATVIGPNTPGIITPNECKLGIMPAQVFSHGKVGLASRSGTLSYEIASGLTKMGIGQSSCVGLGGDPVTGLNFVEVLDLFREDVQTDVVVLIGEIGGNLEELAARHITESCYPKPVVAFVAGQFVPPEKRMGHAGAIILGNAGTAKSKMETFQDAGVTVAKTVGDVAKLVAAAIGK